MALTDEGCRLEVYGGLDFVNCSVKTSLTIQVSRILQYCRCASEELGSNSIARLHSRSAPSKSHSSDILWPHKAVCASARFSSNANAQSLRHSPNSNRLW
jgi:hypothetical protein